MIYSVLKQIWRISCCVINTIKLYTIKNSDFYLLTGIIGETFFYFKITPFIVKLLNVMVQITKASRFNLWTICYMWAYNIALIIFLTSWLTNLCIGTYQFFFLKDYDLNFKMFFIGFLVFGLFSLPYVICFGFLEPKVISTFGHIIKTWLVILNYTIKVTNTNFFLICVSFLVFIPNMYIAIIHYEDLADWFLNSKQLLEIDRLTPPTINVYNVDYKQTFIKEEELIVETPKKRPWGSFLGIVGVSVGAVIVVAALLFKK